MSATEGGPAPRRLALFLLVPVVAAVALLAGTGHYHAARDLADVYREVPCYCGCEEFLGHRDLYDCFVRSDSQGWEAHAAGCGVCIAESALVRDLAAEGTLADEIPEVVIDRFGTTPITAPPR